MKYTETQMEGARSSARLNGFAVVPSDAQCEQFIDWFLANRPKINSEVEAIGLALSGQVKNGIRQQRRKWLEISMGLS